MDTKRWIQRSMAFAMLVLTGCATAETGKTPNIVWIFTDDHSYQTIGAYGGHLKNLNMTPNLDRMAKEGMRFDHAYVENSICGPSRAALLTGKFSHKHERYDNYGFSSFDHNQPQFQKVLQKNGYQTAMIGKIHLAGKMQGFDYWEVLPDQGKYEDPDFITEEGKTQYKGYATDIITDKALEWLGGKRDKSKPFMLMIHHKAPHRNWIPRDQDMDRFEDVEIPEPANMYDDYATRGAAAHGQKMHLDDLRLLWDLKIGGHFAPPKTQKYAARNEYYQKHKPTGKEMTQFAYQLYMKDYLRCIWAVDENIGRVLDALKEQGLDDNTIVMYSSDQGFYMGEHGWFDKRFMYEESFRTPLIARWPGKIKPGSVNEDLVQNIDFAETFLDLAGAPIPDDMQGLSLVPLLEGKTPSDWRRSLYYHYYEHPGEHQVYRHEGVFTGRYKLIRFYGRDVPNGEEWEFFDLKDDPSEMKNVYGQRKYEKVVKKMKQELARLRKQYDVPDEPPPQK